MGKAAIKKFLNKARSKPILAFLGVLFFLLLVEPIWSKVSFVDEHENIAGAWLIANGQHIYSDFFTHHAPLPYLLGNLLSDLPITSYRLVLLIGYILVYLSGIVLLPIDKSLLIFTLLLFSAVAMPGLSNQMYLASSIFWLALAGIGICFIGYSRGKISKEALIITTISLLSIGVWTSLAYVFAAVLILLGLIYSFGVAETHKLVKTKSFQIKLGILAITQLIIFSYLLITSGISNVLWSLVTYNHDYYLPLHLADSETNLALFQLQRLGQYLVENSQTLLLTISTYLKTIWTSLWSFARGLEFANLTRFIDIANQELLSAFDSYDLASFALLVSLVLNFIVLKFKKWWVVLIILLSLRVRDNEIFHLGPYLFALVALNVFLLVQLKMRSRWLLVIPTLSLWLMTRVLWFDYLEQLQSQQPMVSSALISQVNLIKDQNPDAKTLLNLSGETLYYKYGNLKPVGYVYYYHPWLDQVSELRQTVETSIINQDADVVILGSEQEKYLQESNPELLNQLTDLYQVKSNNLYFRK